MYERTPGSNPVKSSADNPNKRIPDSRCVAGRRQVSVCTWLETYSAASSDPVDRGLAHQTAYLPEYRLQFYSFVADSVMLFYTQYHDIGITTISRQPLGNHLSDHKPEHLARTSSPLRRIAFDLRMATAYS